MVSGWVVLMLETAGGGGFLSVSVAGMCAQSFVAAAICSNAGFAKPRQPARQDRYLCTLLPPTSRSHGNTRAGFGAQGKSMHAVSLNAAVCDPPLPPAGALLPEAADWREDRGTATIPHQPCIPR